MNQPDPYTTLGVDPTASLDEIKQIYHRLVRQHHPDLHPDNPVAVATMQAINAAAAVLCDPIKRAAYDRFRRETTSAALGAPAVDSVTAYAQYGRRDGHDVAYPLAITPEEAQRGAQRTLQFHMPDGHRIRSPHDPSERDQRHTHSDPRRRRTRPQWRMSG